MTSEWSFATKGKNIATDAIEKHWLEFKKHHIGSTKELSPTTVSLLFTRHQQRYKQIAAPKSYKLGYQKVASQ